MFCNFAAGDWIFLWFVLLCAKHITPCPWVGPGALRIRPCSRTGFQPAPDSTRAKRSFGQPGAPGRGQPLPGTPQPPGAPRPGVRQVWSEETVRVGWSHSPETRTTPPRTVARWLRDATSGFPLKQQQK